jgi:hypothetical protein
MCECVAGCVYVLQGYMHWLVPVQCVRCVHECVCERVWRCVCLCVFEFLLVHNWRCMCVCVCVCVCVMTLRLSFAQRHITGKLHFHEFVRVCAQFVTCVGANEYLQVCLFVCSLCLCACFVVVCASLFQPDRCVVPFGTSLMHMHSACPDYEYNITYDQVVSPSTSVRPDPMASLARVCVCVGVGV